MDIKWKQQHFHNSCACACLAMLLSKLGIDKQDDDVITEAKMPYRIRFVAGHGGYLIAGTEDRAAEVFNTMLQKYQLMLARPEPRDRQEFLTLAEALLSRGTPFMSTVPTHILPSSGYDPLRQRGEVRRIHTVVIYAADGGDFSLLDPSGGLDRTKPQVFEMVRDRVDLRLSREVLCRELEAKQRPFTADSLTKWDGRQAMAILDLLNQTRAALEQFVKMTEQFGADIQKNSPDRHEDILYDYLGRYFKPVALDWRTAIEAMKERGQAQYQLIGALYDLQETIMKQQKALEEKPGIASDFCTELIKLAQRIYQTSQAHLSSAYSIR